MKRPARSALALALATSFCSANDQGLALEDSLWQLSPEELGQIRVSSIATGTATPLDKAAAVTTVITEADIKAIGATDLDEILETVPGLHVSRSEQLLTPKYIFRGITSTYNPQALLLINGIPVTTLVFGNRGLIWGGMPVQAIKRIEIIRGPGSAVYGADAYSGVINVLTKTGSDISGTEIGSRVGSFDSQAVWLLHGATYNKTEIGVSVEYSTTDGHRETIDEDAQTLLDRELGTSASLAPGPINAGREMVEARVDVQHKDLQFRAGYQGRFNVETGPGVAQALDPAGQYRSDRFNADLTHTWSNEKKSWTVVNQVSYFHGTQEPTGTTLLYPPGAFNGAFPNGLIGNPGFKEENVRLQMSATYQGLVDHRVRIGGGYYWGDVYEVTEEKNYFPSLAPRPGGLESVTDTLEVWLPEKDRTSYNAFVQDEWQFARDWQLTSGVRFDHYSDFGSTVNPRVALIWATTDTITTKLLYGSAFRAPNFQELFIISNPVALGNPDLEPEQIDTYELGFTHSPSPDLNYSLNLFYYQINDYITFVPVGTETNQAQNVGQREGKGGELEVTYAATHNWHLTANYSYQVSTDQQTGADVGEAPNHQAYARSSWSLPAKWDLSTQAIWVGSQKRVLGDAREDLSGRITVDLTIRNAAVADGLGIALSVRNLFDEDVYEPSPGPDVAIPEDFPMPGRHFYGEVYYRF